MAATTPAAAPPSTTTRVSILGEETIVVGNRMNIAAEIVAVVPSSTYIVVTDTNVAKYHLDPLVKALNKAIDDLKKEERPRVLTYIVPPGETVKTRETKTQVENWALQQKCTRDTCWVALGGGVIGDMFGA